MIRFKIPLFNVMVVLYVGDEEYAKFVKSTNEDNKKILNDPYEPIDSETRGNTAGSVFWVKTLDLNDPDELGTLVHEITHVAENITRYLGIEDSETQAYIAGYIMAKIAKRFMVCKKK